MTFTVVKAVALLAILASSVKAYGKCGEGIIFVTTGATPCTFCPNPTCTNTAVAEIPWSCQSLPTTVTETVGPTGCQSFGPCDTKTCATVVETWLQPLPSSFTTTVLVPSGSCFTGWATEATGTNCPTCSTPYCLEVIKATQACTCGNVGATVSTSTVDCITSCACAFVSTVLTGIPCPAPTTTGIVQ
jgi:hypothetical protein